MADVVEKDDVNEAIRLMEMSKFSLLDDESAARWVLSNVYRDDSIYFCANQVIYFETFRHVSPVDAIYGIIREIAGQVSSVK